MPNYTTDRRWYLNADQTAAVEEGDPQAATLLAGEGTEVTEEVAKQYDLANKAKAKPVQTAPAEGTTATETPDAPAQPPPAEPAEGEKAAEGEADKAQRPAANKAR
jgi:hypothetical protein